MKRVITVTGNGDTTKVRIRIEVSADRLSIITRDEVAFATEQLAGDAMESLARVRYVSTPLARQRVSR